MNWIKKKWNQVSANPKTIRDFGLILSVILLVLGCVAFFRGHRHYWIEWPLGVVVFVVTFSAPRVLTYVYKPWMIAAEGISWILIRMILGFLFYFVITPISVVMRISGKDVLDQKIDRTTLSYWKKRSPRATRDQYERLF